MSRRMYDKIPMTDDADKMTIVFCSISMMYDCACSQCDCVSLSIDLDPAVFRYK